MNRITTPAPTRVLLLLPEAFRATGGIQAYLRLLLRALQESEHRASLECQALLLNDHDQDLEPVRSNSLRLWAASGSRPRFVATALWRALAWRPNLVIFGHLNFAPLGLGIRALRPSASQWLLAYGVEAWKRLGTLHRLGLRQADKILSISEFTKRELARTNGIDISKIGLLPCAVDPEWMDTHAPSGTDGGASQTLLTVSRLEAGDSYKGIDQVLRALPQVLRSHPDARFVIVGDGNDRRRLEELAGELGVAARVDFRGRVPAAELARAYADCALFVMPSGGEGFGIVFIEAAAFGKASLATHAGAVPEVIVDGVCGRLVVPDDLEALASTIADLLAHPDELRRLGAQARERAERLFTYQAFRMRLAEHLDALPSRPPRDFGPIGETGSA